MICKIIEDDYTFEQIESIEAIEELEKKYNLNISIFNRYKNIKLFFFRIL